MNANDIHRTQCAIGRAVFVDYSSSSSSAFYYVSKNFCESVNPYPMQRIFSLARSKGCKTLIREKIRAKGMLAQENADLNNKGFASGNEIYRFSFWRIRITKKEELAKANGADLLGYMIVKRDIDADSNPGWYVFESVFVKYRHRHNCIPGSESYRVRVGSLLFVVCGVLYCQQNRLTKTCAQVSIRSLLSRLPLRHDVDIATINRLASEFAKEREECYKPSDGLSVPQIQHVLKSLKVRYWDVFYPNSRTGRRRRKEFPFQRVLYSGIESGCGSLLWFKYKSEGGEIKRHIIPLFGHTFNKDAWVSDAGAFYFNVDGRAAYLPSENWMSSFIGHDDNFGSDFCIPRFFINARDVEYVVALLPDCAEYPGIIAEVVAWSILEALVAQLYCGDGDNIWRMRLLDAFMSGKRNDRPQIILRTIYMCASDYCAAIARMRDKFKNREMHKMVSTIKEIGGQRDFWVVEVSLPQLFPANEAKVGEIVLDASMRIKRKESIAGLSNFLFARLPGAYFFYDKDSQKFIRKSSSITSHTHVFTFAK